jgi:hypothetical protein
MASLPEAAQQLDAEQLRELLATIVENVDDAADVALKLVERPASGDVGPQLTRRLSLSLNHLKDLVRPALVMTSLDAAL